MHHDSLLVACCNNVFILHYFRCRPITTLWPSELRSPRVWIWQLKLQLQLQTTYDFWFMYKHIVANEYCRPISPVLRVRKVSKNNSDLLGYSRTLILVPFDRPRMISYYVSTLHVPFPKCYHLFTKIWQYHETLKTYFGGSLSCIR